MRALHWGVVYNDGVRLVEHAVLAPDDAEVLDGAMTVVFRRVRRAYGAVQAEQQLVFEPLAKNAIHDGLPVVFLAATPHSHDKIVEEELQKLR